MTRRTDVGDRVGEYVLEAKLGQGSFGEVWKARHRALDDLTVAIKLPRDARALARLRDEGTLARRVESDAAVKLLGLDLEHDPPYLAMQFVDGESLREVLKRGALPPRRAIEIARRVFTALAAAHDAKVIHRDVKPENILIDRAGLAYLADFGLAAALGDGSVDLGSLGSQRTAPIIGTVRYLSPEQKDPRRTIDGRSDLYAAGLVFFEMLTGTLPEGGELPSDLVPSLDKHYDAIFAKCYARLERRFKSAKDVVEALDRLVQRLDAPKIVASLLTGATIGVGPTGPGFVMGARDPRLLRPAPEKSPIGNPNLIGWDEARAILRVQDQDLQRFVDRGAISRVSFGGRLLFRRSDIVEMKSRLRRILTPGGLDYYVLPKPQPPRRERPAVVETATNTCALPWLAPSTKIRPAGALVRSFAFGVDALAVAALAVVLGTELFSGPALLLTYLLGGSELCLTPGVLDAASIGVLAFLYFSLLTGLLGRTFGKWLFGLKVTDATGEPLGVGRSAARTLGYVVSATPLGLGFLGIVLHPEHRGFHDLVADSVVAHE